MKNGELINRFKIALLNKYEVSITEDANRDIIRNYTAFAQNHKKATEECVPLKHKYNFRISWENKSVISKGDELKLAAKTKTHNSTAHNTKKFNEARRNFEKKYKPEQQKYLQLKIHQLHNAAKNPK